ncbi:hypothetical protein BKA57DRAFT_441957 [Linnemannia elongata]|nr:hypothetical protein BKA57DRAFT_441957 [Linnemannia elongata]
MSNHPLDQLDPHVPGSNNAKNTVRTRKRDKIREFCGFPKPKSKEVKHKASNQSLHSRSASQHSARPSSIVIQVDSGLPGEKVSFVVTQVDSDPSSHINSGFPSGIYRRHPVYFFNK